MIRVFQLVVCVAVLVATAGQVQAGIITIQYEFQNSNNDVVGSGAFQFDETLDGTVIDFSDLSSFQFSIPSPGSGTIYDLDFLNSGSFSPFYGMSFDTSTDTFQTISPGSSTTILTAIKSDLNSGFFVRPLDSNPLVRDYVQGDNIPYSSLIVERSSVTAVPEPTSLALLATGAFGFMGYGWRRKQKLAA